MKIKPRHIPGWHVLEFILVFLLISILNLFPISWISALSRFLGDCSYAVSAKRRKTILDNLDIAYGNSISQEEKQKIARESVRSLVTSLVDFFMVPSTLRRAEENFEFEGTEHLDQAFKEKRGVIFVISHLGSWEYLAFLPYLRKYPCSVVVRNIRNPYLENWARKNRQKTGLNPIDREKSVRQILTELKNNHLVAILIDQWAGPDGLWQDFFSKPTSTTSVPARLARKTNAALIPGYCLRTGTGKYKIKIDPEVPLAEGEDWEAQTTRRLNLILEQEIMKHPEQWTWGHRRWKPKSRYRAASVENQPECRN